MKITDYEIFKFSDNVFTEFENNGKQYLLNKHPYLDIVLTDFCNADCSFCIADLIHEKLKGNFELMKEKISFAIENMQVKEVLLLGGEPTMSPMLMPMIKWLASLGKLDKIIMTTNGFRLEHDSKYRSEVLSAGLTNINVSFMNTNIPKQLSISNPRTNKFLTISGLAIINEEAKSNGVEVRINNNIFKNSNDTTIEILNFYDKVKEYCSSVKFSPLFPVDNFSVLNVKTQWVKDNILEDSCVQTLFDSIEDYFKGRNISIIENDLQFGFVKNTMIPLSVPIILNWNFGKYTSMMNKVVNEHKINNLKLLPNNELSLSWNRELSEYFIKIN